MNRSLLAIAFVSASLFGCYGSPPPDTEGGDDDDTSAPDAGVPTADAPAAERPFNFEVFTSTIQPMLDETGCSRDTPCHGAANGAAGFKLIKEATGADLEANFEQVTTRNRPKAEDSRIYVKGLAAHAGSTALSPADAQTFLDWVKAGPGAAP